MTARKHPHISPLTGFPVDATQTDYGFVEFRDPACGPVAFHQSTLNTLGESYKRKLATVLATDQLRKPRTNPLYIYPDDAQNRPAGSTTIASVVSRFPRHPSSQMNEALINLSRMIEWPSDSIEITDERLWALYCYNRKCLQYLLRQLSGLNYISQKGCSSRPSTLFPSYSIQTVTIEARGWDRIRELTEHTGTTNQAFVAMWFDDSMESVFDLAIAPAVRSAGFNPMRIDSKEHNNKICEEIIGEIRRSCFLVADFTGNRGGVYFEAGYAQGIGIPVIWTVQKSLLSEVHFDTRQFNHIGYSSPEDLRTRLIHRIHATI